MPAALAASRRATQLDPGDAGSHHALGRALLNSCRFADAAESLRLAVTLQDDLAAAHCDLAIALNGLGRLREAEATCRRAVRLAPQLAEGQRLLGELLESFGSIEEAADCFRRAAMSAPDPTSAALDRVKAMLLEGKFREAELELRQAVERNSGNDELYRALGEVLAKEGRFAEAIEACDQALALNPQ